MDSSTYFYTLATLTPFTLCRLIEFTIATTRRRLLPATCEALH